MFEVEKRSLLTKSEYEEFLEKLKSDSQFLKSFDRYSLVYITREDWIPSQEELIDFKIKLDGDRGVVSIKRTLDNSLSAREEIEFPFERDDYDNIVKSYILLGFKRFILTHTSRVKYQSDEFIVTMDYHHSIDKYILEVELTVEDDSQIKEAEEKIDKYFEENSLTMLDDIGINKILLELNMVEKYRLDFDVISNENILKRVTNIRLL